MAIDVGLCLDWCLPARGNGVVIQDVLEGEEKSSRQNTLADFRYNAWKM